MRGCLGWRAGAAIAFSILMVTSMIAPAGALAAPGDGNGPPGNSPGNGNGPPGHAASSTPTDDSPSSGDATDDLADAPPVLKQLEAIQITRNISAGSRNDIPSHIDRAHDRFNRSLAYYRGPTRVNETEAFTHDAVGIRALANLAHTDADVETARRAADLIYRADNETAATTVADARRVVDRFGPEMDNQSLARSAESHVSNAERPLDRGQGVGDADGRQYFGQRAQGIVQLRTAHRQARQAMKMVARDVGPSVSIESEADPVWNGTGTAGYTIRGTVSVVQPSTVENVTVSVDGERVTAARTGIAGVAPGANASFEATFNRTERVNRVEVTVETEADGGQSATDVLRLDGDGLPESYETEIVGTDPLDPDSNSAVTSADESDNGTIDGHEDFDGDRLDTISERDLGTDPHDADTDADDLTDWEETVLEMDPLDSDSDSPYSDANESDNGVEDGAEDIDGDGLTNADEFEHGSSPLYADGDADGLNDTDEIDLGTDPRDPDTDDDFLMDGEELEEPFDTDPLDPDTNDNGIVDGNETYTTTVENGTYDVSVSLTGEGNVAQAVSISNGSSTFVDSGAAADARVAPIVDLQSDRSFESANVTFEYDQAAVDGDSTSIAVARYNETSQTYELLNSTVEPTEGTITAETEHFSRFTVFYVPTWSDVMTADQPVDGTTGGNATTTPVEVLLLMDTSGSMNGNDPDELAKDAGERFVGGLLPDDRVAVMEFAHNGNLEQGLTDDHAAVNDSIRNLVYRGGRGGTRIGPSLGDTNDYFLSARNDSRPSTIVLLTDGRGPGGTNEAQRAADNDITIHTVGFGGANEAKLEQMADITNGTFNAVDSPSDLPDVFSRIAANETSGKDSDGDGLPDFIEREGMRTGTGMTVVTDPNDSDTDGEGLEDGEEVRSFTQHNQTVTVSTATASERYDLRMGYFTMQSLPSEVDSDGDGLDDKLEVAGWEVPVVNRSGGINPYRFDSQCDQTGVQNGQIQWANCEAPQEDITVDSDPLNQDWDADGLTDDVEYNATYTDPKDVRTYNISREHEAVVRTAVAEEGGYAYEVATIGAAARGANPRDITYTDRTDDFDFVMADGGTGFDRVRFRALDGTERTDTWLSNDEELAWSERNDGTLGVWDPDTDDDGLTDGQEIEQLTRVDEPLIAPPGTGPGFSINSERLGTIATNPDTDGDDYWDGWYGIYDVGRTDNVVLYREHLRDDDDGDGDTTDDGVQGDEIVQEQIEYHHISKAPSPFGGDIFNNGTKYHSSVHLGERYWGTNPTSNLSTDRPQPSASFEIDYHAGSNLALYNSTWRDSIQANYRMYGIDMETRDGGILSDTLLQSRPILDHTPPFSPGDIHLIETFYHDTDTEYYLFIGNDAREGPTQISSIGFHHSPLLSDARITALFTDYVENSSNAPRRFGLSRDEEIRAVAQPIAIHEIGHSFDLGENDDSGGEIYSGGPNDATHENINQPSRLGAQPEERWSAMTYANADGLYLPPTNATYTAISMEEWMSMTKNRVNP